MIPTLEGITFPNLKGCQCRVVRAKKEYSKYFSYRQYKTRNKAVKAANIWREKIKSEFNYNDRKRKLVASSNNKSTGILGVCKTISIDKRKNLSYLIFQVAWRDEKGKNHNKSFRVGNILNIDPELEKLALKMAVKFRKEWEFYCDLDCLKDFEFDKYLNWRNYEI